MTRRTLPPFRAEHVGSLLRPAALLDARQQFERGDIDDEQLRQAEDTAVASVVKMQEELGFQAVTDGEFRRSSWNMDFIYQLGGIARSEEKVEVAFVSDKGAEVFAPDALAIRDRLRLDEVIFADHFTALKDVTTTAIPRLSLPSPNFVYHRAGGRAALPESIYPDPSVFWSDLTSAYVSELKGLAERGCKYVQIDDTTFTMLVDPDRRAEMTKRGDDPDTLHVQYVGHLNEVLDARPDEMTITVHMCRGNYRSSWVAQGSYDFVAEALFSNLHVDGFFLEYDDDRSGGFEPLRFVPKDKLVVLGLLTSKRPELESKDDLKRRIEEASRFIDIDQLCLSPQCGFASGAEGNLVSYDDEVAKLELVVETADEVWGS